MSEQDADETGPGSHRSDRATEKDPAPMVLRAEQVAVRDRRRPLLHPVTFDLPTGGMVMVHGDPGHGHTVLALALAGRYPDHSGTVRLVAAQDSAAPPDGSVATSDRELQRRVALVEVPGVSEPDESIPVRTIVGEELAMGGHSPRRRYVDEVLAEHGIDVGSVMEELDAGTRFSLLARLAAARPGVRFVVATLPERFGGGSDLVVETARTLSRQGYGVLITTSHGVAAVLAPQLFDVEKVSLS